MQKLELTGKTRVCGVIGDPIEHTMSPVMHNAAFRNKGLDYIYLPFRVSKGALRPAIAGMRALNIRGLNVTIPHKVAVIPFLDEIDPLADKIGAINTITNDGGILKGYNTDATGFLRALREQGIEPNGKKVVILGAGGAARAISFILAENGSGLTILNRTWAKAKACAGRISEIFNSDVRALQLNRENLEVALKECDILVNTTNVGMSPNTDETPVPSDLFKAGLVLFDIVYNPIRTRLQREAEKSGVAVIGGLDMFLWQGVLAFEQWTGLLAPVDLMKKETIKVLKRYEN
jgi:shikimate dehydrogenase